MPAVRSRLALVAAAVASCAALALPAAAGASQPPVARAAATTTCPHFTVVANDPLAGFTAGVYHRLNFSPVASQLTCNQTYDVLRSYLYAPSSLKGWTVGKLVGSLSGATGKRFTQNGSNGTIGFDVWRLRSDPQPRTVTKTTTTTVPAGKQKIVQLTYPLAQRPSKINSGYSPGLIVYSSGYTTGTSTEIYWVNVQAPANAAGKVTFTTTTTLPQ